MKDSLKVEMYQRMLRIRKFEETVESLFLKGDIPGFIHLSFGQEAVAVGSCLALRDEDYITSTHRGHHYCIAKGVEMAPMMAELFGKKTGLQGGKGGSMHVSDFDKGMLGGYAVVGAGLPVAIGAALACQMQKSGRIVATFFSDGATNIGAFHESLNVAAIWNLPILFVCDNNRWAVSTPIESTYKLPKISDRACAYGIPGLTVDGNDVVAVWQAVNEAASRARQGGGPTFIEAQTYRMAGHFVGDPERTRPKEQLEKWKEKCPIRTFEEHLIADGTILEKNAELIRKQAQKEIEGAIDYAKESPYPDSEDAFKDLGGMEVSL
ncbi:thiamine pyrophosphate-dependent dehydrogenase E1 component subunit alpha [Chloroflexota bacterium]